MFYPDTIWKTRNGKLAKILTVFPDGSMEITIIKGGRYPIFYLNNKGRFYEEENTHRYDLMERVSKI